MNGIKCCICGKPSAMPYLFDKEENLDLNLCEEHHRLWQISEEREEFLHNSSFKFSKWFFKFLARYGVYPKGHIKVEFT